MNLSYKKLLIAFVIIVVVGNILVAQMGGEEALEENLALNAFLVGLTILPICLILYKASKTETYSQTKRVICRILLGFLVLAFIGALVMKIVLKYM